LIDFSNKPVFWAATCGAQQVAHVLVLKNAMVAAPGAAFLAAAEALEVGTINDHSTLPPRRQFLVLP